jgi:hypothetical protein
MMQTKVCSDAGMLLLKLLRDQLNLAFGMLLRIVCLVQNRSGTKIHFKK